MKRILYILFNLFVTISASYSLACAHAGGTDANGGHYNRSTGSYHYHHGHPAHQHTNGNCPYESLFPYLLLVLLPIVVFLVWFLCSMISDSLPHNIIDNLDRAIKNYKYARSHMNSCYKELEEIKRNAIIPDGYEIGKDGLPKEIYAKNHKINELEEPYIINLSNENWGDSITVYTVNDGWKLHQKAECCGTPFVYKMNAYSFCNKRYSICKKCAENYQMPNMDWYVEYLKISSQEKKCELAKEKQNNALNKLQICYNDCNTKTAKFFLCFSLSKRKKFDELIKEYNQIQSY